MKKLFTILIILSLISIAYSQEKIPQTQPSKTDKEPTFDSRKPTLLIYFDPKNETHVKFVETATVGMGKNVNFGAMDVNKEEVQQRLRNLLSRYKKQDGETWDIVCVIGKDNESDVILGTKDIAEYLPSFFRYYSNKEVFPNKPKLEYKRVETIADKFNDLMKKFEEYKKLATEANNTLQSAIEGKSDDNSLITLILLVVFGTIMAIGKIINKVKMKGMSGSIVFTKDKSEDLNQGMLFDEIRKLQNENSQIADEIYLLKNKEEKVEK